MMNFYFYFYLAATRWQQRRWSPRQCMYAMRVCGSMRASTWVMCGHVGSNGTISLSTPPEWKQWTEEPNCYLHLWRFTSGKIGKEGEYRGHRKKEPILTRSHSRRIISFRVDYIRQFPLVFVSQQPCVISSSNVIIWNTTELFEGPRADTGPWKRIDIEAFTKW